MNVERADGRDDVQALRDVDLAAHRIRRDLEIAREGRQRQRRPDPHAQHLDEETHGTDFLDAAELQDILPDKAAVALVALPRGLGFGSGEEGFRETSESIELAKCCRRFDLATRFLDRVWVKMEGKVSSCEGLPRLTECVEAGAAGHQDRLTMGRVSTVPFMKLFPCRIQ